MSVARCASNNADFYDAIFRAHGLPRKRTGQLWLTEADPPPYYSNLLLLDPAGQGELLNAARRLTEAKAKPFSFKDGFSVIDGSRVSFSLLFSATWIMREPGGLARAPWTSIQTKPALAAWEKAWNATSPASIRVFPDRVLDDPALAFFGAESAEGFSAGCIVNQSSDCVGLTNIFGGSYEDALACALSVANGKPIVGYERGEFLAEALSVGYRTVGPLNIWIVG